MNETIVKNVNNIVKENHTLYFLGDFCIPKLPMKEKFERIKYWRSRLHVKEIHFIKGNHDWKRKYDNEFRDIFSSITYYNKFKYNKKKFYLLHYAMRVWNGSHRGTIHCYGHSHGSLPDDPYALSMDIGIDTHPEFRPYHVDEILEFMKTKTWKKVDHHG